MDRLVDLPVMLLNARGDVIAWNPMAAGLLGDLSALPAGQRNLVWLRFVGGGGGRLVADAEERARLDRAAVADLRSAAARYPRDRRLHALVRELQARSPEFARLWDLRSIGDRHSDHKRFVHPELGPIELDCDVLAVPGDDQVLIVYSAPPGSPDADALALLRVLGVPAFSGPDRLRPRV